MLTVALPVYFILLPIFWKGKTVGKYWNKTKIVSTISETTKWYQYVIRYFSLFSITFLMYFIQNGFLHFIAFVCISLYIIIMMVKQKPLFYEKLSRTQNISTIKE